MANQTIENWTAQYRLAAAAREINDALMRVITHGGELGAAVADARRIGISDDQIAESVSADADQ